MLFQCCLKAICNFHFVFVYHSHLAPRHIDGVTRNVGTRQETNRYSHGNFLPLKYAPPMVVSDQHCITFCYFFIFILEFFTYLQSFLL